MTKRWAVWLVVIAVVILGGVLVIPAVFAPRPTAASEPAATAPAAAAPAGAQIMIRIRAVQVAPASAGGAYAQLGFSGPVRASRLIVASEQVDVMRQVIDGLIASGGAEVTSQPAMLVNDGQSAMVQVESRRPGGSTREFFEIETTATVEAGGVALETAIERATADGLTVEVIQDLGLPIGVSRTAQTVEPIGVGDVVLLWLPHGDGAALVEIEASPIP